MNFKNIFKSTILNKYFVFSIFVIVVCAFSISMHNSLECDTKEINQCPSMSKKCIKGFSFINLVNIIMLSVSCIIVVGILYTSIESNI